MLVSISVTGIPAMSRNFQKETINLRILQTTDLHGNILSYNYDNNKAIGEFGLARTASLIKQERMKSENTLLFDTGDHLEGNAFADYAYESRPFHFMNIHPIYKAMNSLLYDGGTVGNHEFNYGVNFLRQSLNGVKYPVVNANIFAEDGDSDEYNDKPFLKPYVILERTLTDTNGRKHKLKIGVIGFVTPIVEKWNIRYFQGNLIVKNIKKTAEYFIPQLKIEGADVIVALAHTGLNADKGLDDKSGNSASALAKVKGIDAILFGHSHSLFPVKDKLISNKGIDMDKGTIHGTAAVQAGYWGNHLGIIDLKLEKKEGKWKVKKSQSKVKSISKNKKTIVPQDPHLLKIMEKDHKATIDYIKNKK